MASTSQTPWSANNIGFIKGTTLHYETMDAPSLSELGPENISGQVAVLSLETVRRVEEILASVKSPTKAMAPWDWDEWRNDSRKRFAEPGSPTLRASPALNQFRTEEIMRKIMDYKKELVRHTIFQKRIRTIVKIYPRIIDQSDDSTKAEAEAEADKNNDTTSHDSSYNDLMSELHGALEELDVKSGSPINN
jgi:hypothetical protein